MLLIGLIRGTMYTRTTRRSKPAPSFGGDVDAPLIGGDAFYAFGLEPQLENSKLAFLCCLLG